MSAWSLIFNANSGPWGYDRYLWFMDYTNEDEQLVPIELPPGDPGDNFFIDMPSTWEPTCIVS